MNNSGNQPAMEAGTGNDKRERSIYKVTIVGAIANLLLCAAKLLTGIIGHSAAMTADAIHSLSDLVTDFIVIAFVRISSKPQDRGHEYGHGKYETLATSIIGMALLFVGMGMMWSSAAKIWASINGATLPMPGSIALWAALLSIAVKELLFQYTYRAGRRLDSPAVTANAWHHRSDAFSSIGTAIGIGGALAMGSRWTVLDPIAALVVSILIVHAAIEQLRPSIGELVENSLPEDVENSIRTAITEVPGVCEPHHLRTRKIGNRVSIEVHIRMDGNITLREAHDTTRIIERRLKDMFGSGTFVITHVEPTKQASPAEKGSVQ